MLHYRTLGSIPPCKILISTNVQYVQALIAAFCSEVEYLSGKEIFCRKLTVKIGNRVWRHIREGRSLGYQTTRQHFFCAPDG